MALDLIPAIFLMPFVLFFLFFLNRDLITLAWGVIPGIILYR